MTEIAIIIPAFNEAESISNSLEVIASHVDRIPGITFNLMVIDDGSVDATADIVRDYAANKDNVLLLSLSRHFGKESAINAGLNAARDFDAAIVMDSDLQHPPAMIESMIECWQQGIKVVEAVKESRGNETRTKGVLVKIYYGLFNYLTRLNISGDTDFKLLDRAVVQAYCALPEHGRFFRGLVKWMNFPSQQLSFDVPPSSRKRSAWGSGALFRYAVASITSFTAFPLQIVTLLGGLTFLLSLVIGGMALADKLAGRAVDGFTTVILLILLIGSVLMFSVGLIGIYIGRIYDEVKRRPSYLIDEQRSLLTRRDKH
ncbi:glycosyltransferase family 2 protein [Pseudohongiella spirulinae]|uniref:Glycosyl transferase, group 2 family protein n=1 Tax=Pseudohongiella spirulinae TaxID=1249552 RepID=A0A0S2KA67_9GAMM|nr:glycosyltransferase family 2 protein [Pseudohongiella spirulinae]ALO45260.1 Glycosyl transferase, group 2 family protein [Pseudohongiella spirulinae]